IAYLNQDRVARCMAMSVIKLLEVVHIRHDDTDRISFAHSSNRFECEYFFQVTPVEQPGQRIPDGQLTQPRCTRDELLCLRFDLVQIALSDSGHHHNQYTNRQDKEECIKV